MLDRQSFTYASEDHSFFQKLCIRIVEVMTGKIKLWKLYKEFQIENNRCSETFWDGAIRKLDVSINYDRKKLDEIPKTGALVVVANHPYGVLDGLILSKMMSRVRGDYKILTNSVLCKADQTKDNLLEIDFSQTEAALKTNLETRKAARKFLKSGGAIAVFPAGGVSTAPSWFDKVAQDTQWQPFIAGLVHGAKADVVPIFFEGQNSRLFQIVSQFSQTLRVALIFKEVVDKIGWTIGVKVGDKISYSKMESIKDRNELCDFLRTETYKTGGMMTLKTPKKAYRIDVSKK